MARHEAQETVVEVEGLWVVVRAWYCTPRQGWFWSARAEDEGVPWATRSLTHAWPSAAAATEVAAAAVARLLA